MAYKTRLATVGFIRHLNQQLSSRAENIDLDQ